MDQNSWTKNCVHCMEFIPKRLKLLKKLYYESIYLANGKALYHWSIFSQMKLPDKFL